MLMATQQCYIDVNAYFCSSQQQKQILATSQSVSQLWLSQMTAVYAAVCYQISLSPVHSRCISHRIAGVGCHVPLSDLSNGPQEQPVVQPRRRVQYHLWTVSGLVSLLEICRNCGDGSGQLGRMWRLGEARRLVYNRCLRFEVYLLHGWSLIWSRLLRLCTAAVRVPSRVRVRPPPCIAVLSEAWCMIRPRRGWTAAELCDVEELSPTRVAVGFTSRHCWPSNTPTTSDDYCYCCSAWRNTVTKLSTQGSRPRRRSVVSVIMSEAQYIVPSSSVGIISFRLFSGCARANRAYWTHRPAR